MTREEAIKMLNYLATETTGDLADKQGEYAEFLVRVIDSLDMAIAALREQPQWISVEERLPVIKDSEPWGELVSDKGYRFLVADDDGYVFTENFWIKANRFGDPSVTHWMPLPEPPEVEG